MNTFDELLGSEMDKAELYKKIFVPFNLNTTAEADFKMIPGVGDRMAHEFEEYRPYTSIQQFRREIGKYVDEGEVARYENYVFVPVELNSAHPKRISKPCPGSATEWRTNLRNTDPTPIWSSSVRKSGSMWMIRNSPDWSALST